MAAGDTQITIAGNLVDDPELRFTPAGQPVANFRVASTPRFRDNATERVEGRRQPVPDLQRVAAGRGERGRVADPRDAGHRLRAAAAAVLRDQGRREADRVRGRGRRRRPLPAERLGQGQPSRPLRRGRRLRRRLGGGQRGQGGQGGGGGQRRRPGRLRRRGGRPVGVRRAPAAATPTSRRSRTAPFAVPYQNHTIPAGGGALQRSTMMAKPPMRKPKKKVCAFCQEQDLLRRLQGHRPAPQVHLRPRQDPRPPGDRELHAAPARRRHGDQERPRDGPAAVHQHGALRGGGQSRWSYTDEAHPHPGGQRPRRAR